MKEDYDDNKKSLDPDGYFPLRGGGVERRGRGRLFAQQPDADSRTIAHCPRQAIGVGAPVYPCERDGDGHCWRCDRYGFPVTVNPAIPDGYALFVGNGKAIAIDLAHPELAIAYANGYVHFERDEHGHFHHVPLPDRRGGES